MLLVRSGTFLVYGWNMIFLCFISFGVKSVLNADVQSDLCPPDEMACTCSFSEEVGMEYPSVYDTPVLISCKTSDIPAILNYLPKRRLVDMKLYIIPGDDTRVLAPATFLNFSKLMHLDLSGNTLTEVQPGAFHDAQMLVKLKLSDNFLTELPTGMFSGTIAGGPGVSYSYRMSALQELVIANNDITFIADGVFEALTNLRYLDLSRNRIEQIDNFTFSGLYGLRVLILAGNILRETNSSIWHVLEDIREINLSENEISHVEPTSFEELRYLDVLRLDKNKIEGIDLPGLISPSVRTLNLSHNSISYMPYTFFHISTSNLTWVYLDNNGLTNIEFDVWKSTSIVELYLNNNNLGKISVPFLWGLYHLDRLEMKNNRLYQIDKYMMGNLKSLRYLNLDHNELSILSSDIFNEEYNPRQRIQAMPASAILELSINHNRLSKPVTSVIRKMREMTHYTMNNNKIYILQSADIPFHGYLVELDFSYNHIFMIGNDVFRSLSALERINLAGNYIQTLAATAFQITPTTLILDNNPLVCDCNVAWIRESVLSIGDAAHCAAPAPLENVALSSLEPSDLHCSIQMNSNISTEMRSRQGSGVVLDCPIVPQTVAIVEWFISSYNYSEGKMNLVKLSGGSNGSTPQIYPNGSLYIKEIMHDSDTNYSCKATNNVDEKIFVVMLRVTRSNQTRILDEIDPDSPTMVTNAAIMKYALGGTAGTVFLIGLIVVLLALSLQTSRNQKKGHSAVEKDTPDGDKDYKQSA